MSTDTSCDKKLAAPTNGACDLMALPKISLYCHWFIDTLENACKRLSFGPEVLASIYLLQLQLAEIHSSHVQIDTSPVLQPVKHANDESYVKLLEQFVGLSFAKDIVLSLRDNPADTLTAFFLWVVCDWNPSGVFLEDESRWTDLRVQLRRLSVRLVEVSLRLPPTLYLDGSQISTKNSPYPPGHGSYATVYYGWWRMPGCGRDIEVAIKAFKQYNSQLASLFKDGETQYLQSLLKEAAVASSLRHPYICRPLGVARNICGSPLALISRWWRYGDVAEYVKTPRGLTNSIRIAYQLACGLAYLHGENILHCDLHPGNVLIDDDGCAQLTDFGLSNFADSTPATASLSRTGATRYKAPEIHKAEEEDDVVKHSKASDVFSLGMVIVHIITGKAPFDYPNASLRNAQVRCLIRHGRIPDLDQVNCVNSELLRELLRACWSFDPKARPSAAFVASRLRVFPLLQ